MNRFDAEITWLGNPSQTCWQVNNVEWKVISGFSDSRKENVVRMLIRQKTKLFSSFLQNSSWHQNLCKMERRNGTGKQIFFILDKNFAYKTKVKDFFPTARFWIKSKLIENNFQFLIVAKVKIGSFLTLSIYKIYFIALLLFYLFCAHSQLFLTCLTIKIKKKHHNVTSLKTV